MSYQKKIGNQGEARVAQYLARNQHVILARQWHCRYGEIDIISYDCRAHELVFIEVKTRSVDWLGRFPVLHPLQQERLAASISLYVSNVQWTNRYRFDLAIVRPDGPLTYYRHMPLE
ncbi:MAG: YraN family protein [Candidatus Kerfeldbacteria bacterium]|nr:YraN family protein [Candidatus Kerfeldbacteria bacterium]